MQTNNTVQSLNPRVFYPSSILIALLLAFAFFMPSLAESIFNQAQELIVTNGSWFYVLSVAVILLFVVYLGFSKYGEVRLGPDHATPDYSLLTWLSMLFAAGMGIGLMFFGVAEPLMHFLTPPSADPQTLDAAREALKTTFFHWGFHAWAIYAVVALVMAYFCFRHGLPLTLRSALYPLIGDRIYGWIGHAVDIFAVTSTIFGVATSLGIGASQINSGLAHLFAIEVNNTNQVLLMIGVIAIAVVSVMSGLDKGIRRLSEANMILAVALLVFILVLGPTVFLLKAYLQNTGAYLSDIVRNTFNLFAYEKTDWIGGWTIFYWGWWIAWAPFVGLFIARISRGRTIREFVLGVLLIPSAFTLFWMTVFGNSAIDLVLNQDQTNLASMVNDNTSVALFVFLEHFPFSQVLSGIAVAMVVIFFVTSCDSGAMVVDMLCSNGHNNTPLWQRIYWAVAVGVVAIILMTAGGLNALQTMTIASALPFAIILLIALFGLIKALRVEGYKRESLQMNAVPMHPTVHSEGWRERLQNIVDFPNRSSVERYIEKIVTPALNSVVDEFSQNQIESEVKRVDRGVELIVRMGDEHDFVYGVHRRKHIQPEFAAPEQDDIDTDDEQSYYRAEVHLQEGGQDYDIMGWSKLAVINDVIDQYHKHMHFLHLLR
ncbi:BCCT family transporter [Alteromonas sp. a30]|uniref:BCCT family transporter n=1 Tax=Alteromonas sp. a30 TaxID=2730917 RepID=UPI002280E2ED|nr:choline BCCT transporter BetT [Alteromonas sp. a30]MCY7295037.1 choline BCCT transporter BetT [Alteromonas sp. a30]